MKYKKILRNDEYKQFDKSPNTIDVMLKRIFELMADDIGKVRGIGTHALDSNDASLEKTEKLIPSTFKQILTLICSEGSLRKIVSPFL